MPDYREQGCPIASDVDARRRLHAHSTSDAASRCRSRRRCSQNHGNHIALARQPRGVAGGNRRGEGRAGRHRDAGREAAGRERPRGRACSTGDKGVTSAGEHKPNYQPGADLPREGDRAVRRPARHARPRRSSRRSASSVGQQPAGLRDRREGTVGDAGRAASQKGRVIHTMGFPLPNETFGGGFIYGMDDTHWAVGFVTGLDYRDPDHRSARQSPALQDAPVRARAARGRQAGRVRRQGDPRGRLVGDAEALGRRPAAVRRHAAGFLNGARLKGIHLAMKSGMLAAETLFECLLAGDFSKERLAGYERRVAELVGRRRAARRAQFPPGLRARHARAA